MTLLADSINEKTKLEALKKNKDSALMVKQHHKSQS